MYVVKINGEVAFKGIFFTGRGSSLYRLITKQFLNKPGLNHMKVERESPLLTSCGFMISLPEPHELTPPFAEDEFLPVLTPFKKTKVLTFDIVNKRVSEPTKTPNLYALQHEQTILKR